MLGREDVDAILQRCGVDTYDLVLVAPDGEWTRAVFTSKEAAEEAARTLGAFLHDGWDEETLAKRFSHDDPWNTKKGRRRAV